MECKKYILSDTEPRDHLQFKIDLEETSFGRPAGVATSDF